MYQICVCVRARVFLSRCVTDTVDEVNVPTSAWDSDPVCVCVFVLEWYKPRAFMCVCAPAGVLPCF